MTARNSSRGQPQSTQRTVRLKRLHGITRTRRFKTATPTKQWRKNNLVATNQQHEATRRERNSRRLRFHFSLCTGLRTRPTPGISTSTMSPFFRKTGGFLAAPTPAGEPVRMMVPASNVVPSLSTDIIFATE